LLHQTHEPLIVSGQPDIRAHLDDAPILEMQVYGQAPALAQGGFQKRHEREKGDVGSTTALVTRKTQHGGTMMCLIKEYVTRWFLAARGILLNLLDTSNLSWYQLYRAL